MRHAATHEITLAAPGPSSVAAYHGHPHGSSADYLRPHKPGICSGVLSNDAGRGKRNPPVVLSDGPRQVMEMTCGNAAGGTLYQAGNRLPDERAGKMMDVAFAGRQIRLAMS